MAAINTTFGFKDQITQSLSLLNQTLTSMNKTLAAMQAQMSGTNTAIQQVGQSAQQAADNAGGLNTKLLNFNSAVQVFNTVKGAVDSVGHSIAECSSLYNFQIAQETKLESVMRSRMKATDETIQSIKDFASAQQKIGVIGDEVQIAGLQELATYVEDAETLKTLLPMLNDIAVQASAGGEVSAQLETSLATMVGKVMGGNLSGMSKRGWVFTEAEEEAFKTMNEQQKAEFLRNYAKDAIGNQNEDFAKTAQGQMIQIQNQMGDLKENVGRAILPFTQLKSIVTGNWKISFYETIVKALNFVTRHINQVVIALGALGVSVLVVGTYFVILQRKAIASAIATAAAWAVAHLPLFLILSAILLVISAIAALLIFSSKTFPAIGGFIGGVAGVAKEVGAQIKYYFGTAIEWIVNGFITMKNNVVNAFLTLFDFLLSGVGKVASAMDAVFGTSFADNVAGFMETLNAMKNAEQVKFSLGWEDNRRGLKNAWAEGSVAGRQVGADLSDRLNKQIDKLTGGIKNAMGGQKSALDNMTFGSDGSLKTSDASLVDIADDYKELLSARARERFNLKFSQMTPEINFGDVTITGEGDEDRLIKKLADTLLEAATAYTRESA